MKNRPLIVTLDAILVMALVLVANLAILKAAQLLPLELTLPLPEFVALAATVLLARASLFWKARIGNFLGTPSAQFRARHLWPSTASVVLALFLGGFCLYSLLYRVDTAGDFSAAILLAFSLNVGVAVRAVLMLVSITEEIHRQVIWNMTHQM